MPSDMRYQTSPPVTAASFPWTFPVPVRASRFTPLDPCHAPFNVEVALSGIRAFEAVTKPKKLTDLLFADLQDNPVANQRGRLGSGRAGFYRGKYLKGVGRTPTAANWNDGTDLDHSNGALLASGGIREYLVTVYLNARGLGHVINGAEGILVRPLSRHLRPQFRERMRAVPTNERPPHSALSGDQALQTLTVKDAPFARFSNLIWLLNHVDFGSHSMLRFDEYFRAFVSALGLTELDSEMLLEPASVLDVLDYTIEKTIDYFRQTWSAGVFWGSVHNNFAMDGRFLDLEFPVILGSPLAGIVADVSRRACTVPSRSAGTGLFEVVRYIRHVRAAYLYIIGRLETIVADKPRSLARDYCTELLQLMRQRGDREHMLFSADFIAETLCQWVAIHCEVDANNRTDVRKSIYRACWAQLDSEARGAQCEIPVRPVPMNMARLGFVFRPVIHVLDGVNVLGDVFAEGAFVNALIDKLDHETDVDRLLSGLQSAADEIRRHCTIQPSSEQKLFG